MRRKLTDDVLGYLGEAGMSHAEEIARDLKVNTTAVRAILHRLRDEGVLVVTVQRRPPNAHLYRIKDYARIHEVSFRQEGEKDGVVRGNDNQQDNSTAQRTG